MALFFTTSPGSSPSSVIFILRASFLPSRDDRARDVYEHEFASTNRENSRMIRVVEWTSYR
jgi:hypothetical protein